MSASAGENYSSWGNSVDQVQSVFSQFEGAAAQSRAGGKAGRAGKEESNDNDEAKKGIVLWIPQD
jgi:hypothetical protein